MKKLIAILFTAITLTGCTQNAKTIATPAKQNQKSVKSFKEWCEEKYILPQETKRTVEVLLKKAGTQNCEEANRKLILKIAIARNS
jgi:internalin A